MWIKQATENLNKKLKRDQNKDYDFDAYTKHAEKAAMIEFLNEDLENKLVVPKYDFGFKKHWNNDPEWAIINYSYNLLERSMGQNSTRTLMNYYFDLTNHIEGENEDPEGEVDLVIEDFYKELDFESVKEVSLEEDLSNTKYNRLRKSKSIFASQINTSSLKPEQKTALFKKFLNDKNLNLNSLFWNNYASRVGIQKTFEKEMERFGYGFLSSDICLKFTLMEKLIKKLGLNNTCDTSTIISQKTIDEKWKSIEILIPQIIFLWKTFTDKLS